MLLDQVCDWLLPAAESCSVVDVRLGLGYTAVQLDDGRCGLAYTFRDETHEGCCVIGAAGTLAGRQASDVALWTRSADLLASGIGLATLNALIDVPAGASHADLLAQLEVTPEDTIGMVGCFGPFIAPLRARSKALHIFERRPNDKSKVLPESAAIEILPECDVVILTATTLLNRTMDQLLDCCRKAREVAVVGPSTPFLPGVFHGRGVTILSGVQIVDAKRVLCVVSEGGGTRQFGVAVKKITVRVGQ